MLARLTHAAIAFAVTAVLYQAYVLAVVPFVEPAGASVTVAPITPSAAGVGRSAVDNYRTLLSNYFPAGHWCLEQPPKTFENGQALIVLEKYEPAPDGKVDIPRCAIVFFPRRRDSSDAAPRDAIVMEPSEGALLQMEQAEGAGVGGFGRMQYGQLKGKVVVRSDMREPGPQDDLLITTRDVYMNEDRIRTPEAVELQLGPHFGRGRGLEITFLPAEPSRAAPGGGLYGSLDSLEILEEVAADVAPGRFGFFGKKNDAPAAPAAEPPIRIQSKGPFRIEFAQLIATFSDRVRVRQVHPDGKLDELLAEELNLYFTKLNRWSGDAAADSTAPPAEAPAYESFALEPASIMAKGVPASPVILTAQSHDASAQCLRLWLRLAERKVTLDGGAEVTLSYKGAEVHAPMVEYTMPPKGSTARLGVMQAKGGAGRLRAVADPRRPNEVIEVNWKEAMQLVRRRDADGVEQPVLVLDGRPKATLGGLGTLYADRLQLFLRELAAAPAAGAADQGAVPSTIVAEQITASGRVSIESSQLTGKVNELNLVIDNEAPQAAAGAPAGGAAAGQPLEPLFPQQGAGRSYDVQGVVLRLDVAMRDRKAVVRGVTIDGAVDFKELAADGSPDPPLRIQAEHVAVAGADTPNAEIVIRGAGGQNGLPLQLAQIDAGGTEIRAPLVKINRGAGQAVINSPGTVELLVDRDLTGQPLAQPERLVITWRDAMELDKNRLSFLGDVYVKQASGWLQTQRLVAQLDAPVRFDGGGGGVRPQVEQIECWEGAAAEFDQVDELGLASRQRLEARSLSVNKRTGLITGQGPGFVDSVHKARGGKDFLALPGQPAAAAPAAAGDAELRHLHVDFVRAVGGNLHQKTVNVQGDVRAVYGPVATWDDRLAMSPGGSPGAETVWITCDQLGVTESPMAPLMNPKARQVELEAIGHVVVEGQNARRGAFNATGHKMKYDQSKGTFMLEWDGRTPATIAHQEYPGAPASPQSAQQWSYNLKTGEAKIHGLQKIQVNQFDLSAPPPATSRR
jgi:hypothetical protein